MSQLIGEKIRNKKNPDKIVDSFVNWINLCFYQLNYFYAKSTKYGFPLQMLKKPS